MWDTLQAILPYTIGFIVSPLPVIGLILILVGNHGIRRATVFELFWLATSFASILILMLMFEALDSSNQSGEKPDWQYMITVFMGFVLLLVALIMRTRVFRKKHEKRVRTPGWLRIIDRLNSAEIALLAVALVVLNPVNFSMVLAASINLANLNISAAEAAVPVAIFVIIGSLSVFIPYLLVLVAGKRVHNALHATRHWLNRYGDRLSFWSVLGFSVVFLYKGFDGLL